MQSETGQYPHTPNYVIPIAPGKHLKEKLDERGMTTEQFSEASGLPVEAVELFFVGKTSGNAVSCGKNGGNYQNARSPLDELRTWLSRESEASREKIRIIRRRLNTPPTRAGGEGTP